MSCVKADKVLSAKNVAVAETIDAKKATIDGATALKLLRTADRVLVAKGKSVLIFDMKKDRVSDEDLSAAIGPTGNLRAPAIRIGKTFAVGFSEEMLASILRG